MKKILLVLVTILVVFSQAILRAEEAIPAAAPVEAAEAVKDIAIADLKAAIEAKSVFILDCNGSDSFSKGHIPGAVDFEEQRKEFDKLYDEKVNPGPVNYEDKANELEKLLEEKGNELEKLLPDDKCALVVTYCGGPECKAYRKAHDLAIKLGYTNVMHLSAGIKGWKDAGEKLDVPTPAAKSH